MPAPRASVARPRDRRRDVVDERRRVEDVRRAERVEPEQLEMRRGDRLGAPRSREVGGVHPELARAVVADEPDALEPGAPPRRRRAGGRAGGGPRAAAIASSRRSSPGDSTVTARTPAATAAAQLVVALAGAGDDDPVRVDARARTQSQLAAGRDVRPEPEPTRGGATTASAGLALTA